MEACGTERDPGEQPDLGVSRFDQALKRVVIEVGVDGFDRLCCLCGQFRQQRPTTPSPHSHTLLLYTLFCSP